MWNKSRWKQVFHEQETVHGMQHIYTVPFCKAVSLSSMKGISLRPFVILFYSPTGAAMLWLIRQPWEVRITMIAYISRTLTAICRTLVKQAGNSFHRFIFPFLSWFQWCHTPLMNGHQRGLQKYKFFKRASCDLYSIACFKLLHLWATVRAIDVSAEGLMSKSGQVYINVQAFNFAGRTWQRDSSCVLCFFWSSTSCGCSQAHYRDCFGQMSISMQVPSWLERNTEHQGWANGRSRRSA